MEIQKQNFEDAYLQFKKYSFPRTLLIIAELLLPHCLSKIPANTRLLEIKNRVAFEDIYLLFYGKFLFLHNLPEESCDVLHFR